MNWSIVSAVNNEEVLRSCLLASPDLEQDVELIVEKGHPNAASAYNSGMKRASADHIIFAHQDMYFPKGWLDRVECAMHALESQDPNWGVLGAWGTACDGSGEMYGHLYDGGWRRTLGGPYAGGQQVEALDEVVLILRKSSGLQFDTSLPGFHFYGADICLEARSRGMKCYAISALCIHNTNSYGMLPLEFWKCYWLMRRKWRARLPIRTTCAKITRSCWPAIFWNLDRAANIVLGRHKKFRRVADPARLYRELSDMELQ